MAFKMRGFPKTGNPTGTVESIEPDGGTAMVRVAGVGLRKMSGLGIAEIKEGMTVPLVQKGDSYSIDGSAIDTKLTNPSAMKNYEKGYYGE